MWVSAGATGPRESAKVPGLPTRTARRRRRWIYQQWMNCDIGGGESGIARSPEYTEIIV